MTSVRREGDNVMLDLDSGWTVPFDGVTKIVETQQTAGGGI